MKKMLVIVALSLFLTGCFNNDENNKEATPEGFHYYATEEVRMLIPNEWEILKAADLPGTVPDNTIVAFRSNMRRPSFTANVAIIKSSLPQPVSTLDYAKALKQKLKTTLVRFKELNVAQRTMQVAEQPAETLFMFLEGAENPQGDLKHFMHTAGVKGNTAYIAVGSMLATEEEAIVTAMQQMIESFEVR